MANIILIETSSTICSASLSCNNEITQEYINNEPMQHASMLPQYIEKLISHIKINNMQLDAVAISAGPGSYTGLRIATSTAKGICYASKTKLIAINTLDIIAYIAQEYITNNLGNGEAYQICPMIDARRMEIYTSRYNSKLECISQPEALIINKDTFSEIDTKLYFCGDGAEKCKSILQNTNAVFLNDINATASMMNSLAITKFNNKQFEDIAYYEPFYLKEFQTTNPKTQQ